MGRQGRIRKGRQGRMGMDRHEEGSRVVRRWGIEVDGNEGSRWMCASGAQWRNRHPRSPGDNMMGERGCAQLAAAS
jgi:hypothetical protein